MRPPGKLFLLGGDFNYVLQPSFDRFHASRPEAAETESVVLATVLEDLDPVDTLGDLHGSFLTPDEERQYRADYFTFGSAEHGRRLDSFLRVKRPLEPVTHQVAHYPVNYSDHNEYLLQLRRPGTSKPKQGTTALYPGRGDRAEQFEAAVRSGLERLTVDFNWERPGCEGLAVMVTSIQRLLSEASKQVGKTTRRSRRRRSMRSR